MKQKNCGQENEVMPHGVMLSSDSLEKQQENVKKYTNCGNGYFAYIKVGKFGGPNLFYSTLDDAYKNSLENILKHLSQTSAGSRSLLQITDSNNEIVMEGQPMDNGKIHMSIYYGHGTDRTVTNSQRNNEHTNREHRINNQEHPC